MAFCHTAYTYRPCPRIDLTALTWEDLLDPMDIWHTREAFFLLDTTQCPPALAEKFATAPAAPERPAVVAVAIRLMLDFGRGKPAGCMLMKAGDEIYGTFSDGERLIFNALFGRENWRKMVHDHVKQHIECFEDSELIL